MNLEILNPKYFLLGEGVQTRVEIADFENWRKAAKEAAKELDAGGIVAEPVSDVGIGSAIMDRLRRASADRS